MRATFSRICWERRLPAGTRVRARALLVADMMAATACRLEAGAPSRYDVRLGDEREKVARTRSAARRYQPLQIHR
jgi:hypothetical protein